MSTTSASVFTIQNKKYPWNGSGCLLVVYSNGDIIFRKYNPLTGFVDLRANATPFRFNEWHTVGVSFGSKGMKISVDGVIRNSNSSVLPMNSGVGIVGGTVDPLFGGSNLWYLFEGAVDKFRISYSESNFTLNNSCISYTFNGNGNGNWSNAANWLEGVKPPLNLPEGAIIVIDPVPGGECILDVNQGIMASAALIISPGKKFRIPGNVNIK